MKLALAVERAATHRYEAPSQQQTSNTVATIRRRQIHTRMTEKYGANIGMFTLLQVKHLQKLYRLYNKLVFDDELYKLLKKARKSVEFQVTPGTATSKTGGWCKTTNEGFVISVPLALYTSLFTKGDDNNAPPVGRVTNGGIVVPDRLSPLQITLEHELLHMVMQLLNLYKPKHEDPDRVHTSHGKLFRYLASHYFGHTDFHHRLSSLQHPHGNDPTYWSQLGDFKSDDFVRVSSISSPECYEAQVVTVNKKNLTVKRLSYQSFRYVSPSLAIKMVVEPATLFSSIVVQGPRFAVNDFVRVKSRGKSGSFMARVVALLSKNIRVARRGTNDTYTVSTSMLEKVSREEYGDEVVDGPVTSASTITKTKHEFDVGDHVSLWYKGEKRYGRVERKLVKNLRVAVKVGGHEHTLIGSPQHFTRVTFDEYFRQTHAQQT